MSNLSQYTGKIKIFLDIAERKSILDLAANPIIKGITTNPSLMKKAGVSNYKAYCLELLAHIHGLPISYEVFADDFENMRRQGLEIAEWGTNVYVKIPIMNSEGKSSIPLIEELSHRKVKLNVTAVLTLNQVWEATRALRGGVPSILSVFAGRIADTGRDPMPLMSAASEICAGTDKNIELLWASSREALNVVQAELAGCQIITVTPEIIKKMAGFNKDLHALSLDTVKTFKADAEAAGYSL